MTYANQAIMHDIEFLEIIIIIFQPWKDSFYSYIKGSPQWAVVLLTYLTLSKQQNFAPVQLPYVSKAIMHDIGFAETIIMVFRPWTVSTYYYIERQPPMNSCVPDAHNILKVTKVCTSSIGLRQQSHHARYWVCRDYFFSDFELFLLIAILNGCPQWAAILLTHLMFSKWQNLAPVKLINASGPIMYDIGFVETIFEIFWLWTVSSFSRKKNGCPQWAAVSWRT